MDFNRFTEKLQEGFRSAQSIASARGQQQIDVEHLLLALVDQEGGLAQSLLTKADVPPGMVRQKLVEVLDKLPKVSGSAPDCPPHFARASRTGPTKRATSNRS